MWCVLPRARSLLCGARVMFGPQELGNEIARLYPLIIITFHHGRPFVVATAASNRGPKIAFIDTCPDLPIIR